MSAYRHRFFRTEVIMVAAINLETESANMTALYPILTSTVAHKFREKIRYSRIESSASQIRPIYARFRCAIVIQGEQLSPRNDHFLAKAIVEHLSPRRSPGGYHLNDFSVARKFSVATGAEPKQYTS